MAQIYCTILHSSDEPGELLQWHYHDDCTVNIVMAITVTVAVVITRVGDVHAQEAIVKILKMRKRISNAALQTELVEILKNMFLPSKKMIKEQIEWLIEHRYMRRDEDNINQFIYMA